MLSLLSARLSVAGKVVPFRQQHDAICIEAVVLQRIDACDHLVELEIDHGDRAIAHSGQVDQRVLDPADRHVLVKGDVMRSLGGWD